MDKKSQKYLMEQEEWSLETNLNLIHVGKILGQIVSSVLKFQKYSISIEFIPLANRTALYCV